jgi:hypothetical protein
VKRARTETSNPPQEEEHPDERGREAWRRRRAHQFAGGTHAPSRRIRVRLCLTTRTLSERTPAAPALLEDFVLREKVTPFDHERIPERVLHARATAAHGYFELTASLSKYATAKVLTESGRRLRGRDRSALVDECDRWHRAGPRASVRDVIDWRGQHRHLLDGGSDLIALPPVA